ncbi:hypothetical protein L3081_00985 [Colwellia sp. MSW7]|uniref:Acyltransferase 3 domain-containing protein n=1 Tax=Colwellia maritima TaxID=2912588 RepID=A0ABS9WXM3_9GAMM|nr:acyltransferase family protein [Colwellia maritima]MCI2282237.1 hypothetical protein [Colwellia maritima]
MLICTLIIVLSANLFSSRPIGEIEFKNIIPGLTFIDPYWFEKISGIPFSSLEGAFWSLYVEFKFYLIAAFLYYILNEKKLTFSLFGLFLIAVSANQLNQTYNNSIIYSIHSISTHLSLGFFGWFASGASLYLFYKSKQMKWFICGFSMAMISSFLLYRDNYHTMVFAFAISFFFTLTFISPVIQKTLQNRVLMFVGFISYPLYLIHENMMISMVIDLSNLLPSIPLIMPPIMAISFVLLISYIISKYLENHIKNICKRLMDKHL